MNGSAGSSRPKNQKQGLAGSNGAVPASKKESGDPVVGLAVRIVEINHARKSARAPASAFDKRSPYRRSFGEDRQLLFFFWALLKQAAENDFTARLRSYGNDASVGGQPF